MRINPQTPLGFQLVPRFKPLIHYRYQMIKRLSLLSLSIASLMPSAFSHSSSLKVPEPITLRFQTIFQLF